MKAFFNKIIYTVRNFLDRMASQEAERIIKYYSQIFGTKPGEGGGSERIRANARKADRLYRNN
ncbi:MAG: hypothetical protein PHT50_06160 [Candidatus Omnitrophica bacterium]|nr:hypothetical protein [Candidatus Omnitrophota bacterium]